MKKAVIVSGARTPIGNFGGALSGLSAVELGVIAAKAAIQRAGIEAAMIEDVIIGNILAAGLGQNIARQIGIHAGTPETTPAITINQLCGSGLRAVMMAAQQVMMGEVEIVLAGGTESMSNAPYLLPKARNGYRMGDGTIVDSMIFDGLTDAFHHYHMGITAENIATQWQLSRDEQDNFALKSQQKAEQAQKNERFKDEIVAVHIPQKKGEALVIEADEFPKHGLSIDKLAKLRPAFKADGTVTAGNASGINDGAAMLIIMSEEKALSLGLKILARIEGCAYAALDPQIMGYGPVLATRKVLEKANWKIEDIELVEANEAFAAQSLAVIKDLGLDPSLVNVNGGAIALGHPIGASGARILISLLYELEKRQLSKGLATLCIGGGQGISMLVKR